MWVDAPFELCWRIIESETEGRRERPLARDEEQARKLYEARLSSYRLADVRVAVGGETSARELAARVAETLERDGKGI